MNPIRVLVADDHAVVREGIRQMLAGSPGFEMIGETGSGDEVLALARDHAPDVVVLDISMPGKTGLDVTRELREQLPAVRVLILSMHDHPQYVMEAVRAGAAGYLLKDAGPGELRRAVEIVHRGDSYFSPAVAHRLGEALRPAAEGAEAPTLDVLTAREREVLAEVADGKTSKQIAAALGISPRTVETHRESLMKKLGIRSVAGLTRFALETGLFGGDDP